MNESKTEPPKNLLSTAFCRGGRGGKKRGRRNFVMRTRKRREEIITTLEKKSFTQDFRRAAGLATCRGLCDPKRPEKHTRSTDSSFLGRGRK